jgi:cysteine desulfurase
LIYLDYNRTTPLAPSVLESMQPYWATHFLLPGQEHPQARAIGEALEHAREGLATLAGCEPFEIVFTGGGTEANNLGILGQVDPQTPEHVLVSALEHASVLAAAEQLERFGWDVQQIPCGPDGVIDVDQTVDLLRPNTRLVGLQAANPILGTLQPVRELADRCHHRGIPLHCDATQLFGKLPVDLSQMRADTVAISGHKFYGPKGTGALYVRRGLQLSPITFGEPREMGLQAGAGHLPGFIGIGTAATLAARCSSEASEKLSEMRERMIRGLMQTIAPAPILLCEQSHRLPNTIAVELPCEARRIVQSTRQLVMSTARSGSPPDAVTRALRAIGRSDQQIGRTLCISLGWVTSREQVDRAVDMIAEAADGLAG